MQRETGNDSSARLQGEIAIVSPMGSGNALGRALSLADLAADAVEGAAVVAPDDGPLWLGAKQWPLAVNRVKGQSDVARLFAKRELRWIWIVKPLPTSWEIGRWLAEDHPNASLILDFDDDDEQLSREFRSYSLGNWLRLNRFRQLHPSRIAQTRQQALTQADALTVASFAVADELGLQSDQMLRIPHPRRKLLRQRAARPRTDGTYSLGFFGTIRKHKGVDALRKIVTQDQSVVLHVFSGAELGDLGSARERVVEHPTDTPWEYLYSSVDLVALPQSLTKGGDVQLPAKLLDAMRSGSAIISTRTRAISEIAEDTVSYVKDWSDLDFIREQLASSLDQAPFLGRVTRQRFESELCLEAHIPKLKSFLSQVSDS